MATFSEQSEQTRTQPALPKGLAFLIRTLSEEQKRVVTCPTLGNQLIMACAGSGKTLTMLCRILYMIQVLKCTPDSFFVATFTRNAAKHMVDELSRMLVSSNSTPDSSSEVGSSQDPDLLRDFRCGTFHSLARRILHESRLLGKLPLFHVDELQYMLLDFLNQTGASDRFRKTIKHVFVDEFQDVNQVQFDIVRRLGQNASSITVVGDDNQNIYSFRGSDVRFIREFGSAFRDVRTNYLSINFRSTPPVVNLGNAIIAKCGVQFGKPASVSSLTNAAPAVYPKPVLLHTTNSFQSLYLVAQDIENRLRRNQAQPRDFCVLSRNNYLLYKVQNLLLERKVKTVLFSSDDGRSATTSAAAGSATSSRLEYLSTRQNRVVLSTIHSAKGLQWPFVYVIGLHDEFFPEHREQDLDKEWRLFYVAVTRSERHLTICNALEAPSRFIVDLWDQRASLFELQPWQATLPVRAPPPPSSAGQLTPGSGGSDEYVVTVSQCVRSLDGEHYKFLKEHVLGEKWVMSLSSATPVVSPCSMDMLHTDNCEALYDQQIAARGLEPEFGSFVDCLARRMVAQYLFERKMRASDVFRYKPAESCAARGKMAPTAYRAIMTRSYQDYCNPERAWRDILQAIYYVSLFTGVGAGRWAGLYSAMSSEELHQWKPVFERMQQKLFALFDSHLGAASSTDNQQLHAGADVRLPGVYESTPFVLKGEIDLLMPGMVLDFKTSIFEPDKLKLDHLIQVLTYAGMLNVSRDREQRNSDRPSSPTTSSRDDIKHVASYNCLTGQLFKIPIDHWRNHHKLVNYLVQTTLKRRLS